MTNRDQHAQANAAGAVTATSAAVTARTPTRDRAKWLPLKALMVRRARDAAGCKSAEQLSLRLDISASIVKQFESRAYDKEPRLSHMLADRRFGLSLAAEVATAHGATVHLLPAVQHADHASRLAAVTREACTLLTAYTDALRDGCVDAREREELLREARELKAACLEIEAACLEREGTSK